MHRTAALLVLLTMLLPACGDDVSPAPIDVDGPGYRGVILPASAWPSHAYEVEGHWAVTVEDVRRAEAALPAAAKRLVPELEVPLERYVRQYVGIVSEGRRALYVNLLHEDSVAPHPDDDPDEDPDERDAWRRKLVVVDDGGDWYVEGFFDPDRGEFTELFVHGEA